MSRIAEEAARRWRRRRAKKREQQAIRAAGAFDVAWYEFETGNTFASRDDAIADYLTQPGRGWVSPHPLFQPGTAGKARQGLTPLGAYLTDPALRRKTPFVGWEMKRYVKEKPSAAQAQWGAFSDLASRLKADTELDFSGPHGPIRLAWGAVLPRWRDIVQTMARHRALAPKPYSRELVGEEFVAEATPELLENGPLVSIVIPTWNRRDMLMEALESVRSQRWKRWEAIVVDDGSDDGTIEAVERLAAQDSRFVLIRRPHEGVCRARNSGLEAARGDYIAFLDSDNVWTPQYLDRMLATMERDDLGAAYGTLMVETPDGPRYRAVRVDREMLLVSNHVDMNVLIMRADVADAVGGFDESLRRTVDYDLVLRISEHTLLHHIPVVGVQYDNDRGRADRISVREPITWNDVVIGKHLVDWQQVAEAARDDDLISVVLTVSSSAGTVLPAIAAVDTALEGRSWELVVVDSSPGRGVPGRLLASLVTDERIRHLRMPKRLSFALAANVGLADSSGATVVVLDEGIVPDEKAVALLVDAVSSGAGPRIAQPAAIDRDGSIVTAGAVFAPDVTWPAAFLAGQPASVLDAGDTTVGVDSLDGRVLAARAADLIAAQGLTPLFDRELELADLGLRARSAGVEPVLVPSARVVRRRSVWVKDEGLPETAFRDRSAPSRQAFAQRHGAVHPVTDPSMWEQFGIIIAGWEPSVDEEYAVQASQVTRG